ncbi:hypothetical protein GCM10028833_05710 [Glycomyces tarimensis]
MLCAGMALLFAVFALGELDPDGPLWLAFPLAFATGYLLRRTAKRTVRSVERGETLEFDRHGPTMTAMLERRAPIDGSPDLGTADPEPGLSRHVVIGDWVLAAAAAILIAAALIMAVN